MALTVKVTNPAFPDDTEFTIMGLGAFQNGEEREVTKEEEQAYVDATGHTVRDGLADTNMFEVKGTATAKVPDAPEEETPNAEAEKEGEK